MKLARPVRVVLACAGVCALAALVFLAVSRRGSAEPGAPAGGAAPAQAPAAAEGSTASDLGLPAGHPAVEWWRAEMTPERRRHLEDVRDRLQQELASRPEDPELWRRKGFVHQALGEVQEARSAFEKLLSLKPGDEGAYFMLALVHEKLADKARAISYWETCLKVATLAKHREVAQRHLKHLRGEP